MKVGINKLESLDYTWRWKLHDPAVISFESVPACDRRRDRRTDTPPVAKSRSIIAERDKKWRRHEGLWQTADTMQRTCEPRESSTCTELSRWCWMACSIGNLPHLRLPGLLMLAPAAVSSRIVLSGFVSSIVQKCARCNGVQPFFRCGSSDKRVIAFIMQWRSRWRYALASRRLGSRGANFCRAMLA